VLQAPRKWQLKSGEGIRDNGAPGSPEADRAVRIVLAQLNTLVGDVDGNTGRVVEAARRAVDEYGADMVLCPELTLSGYPPEDLLLRASIKNRVDGAIERLCRELPPVHVVVGYPHRSAGGLTNAAAVFHEGRLLAHYDKQLLPNYQVFDEMRYFQAGSKPCVVDVAGFRVGLTICEDIWAPGPAAQARDAGAELICNLNASPFHRGKQAERRAVLAARAGETGLPILYVNQVGGQDELVFDGGSLAVAADGTARVQAARFREQLAVVDLVRGAGGVDLVPGEVHEDPDELDSIYQALVLGVRDYVDKNGFPGVVLGLSGGIDSALTLAVAVDALGPDRVEAVMMPFRYTASMSVEDAAEEARRLGVHFRSISIEPMYDAFIEALRGEFAGRPVDVTEQNIQARCRGVLLMAISNKKGSLVLTTGNKSEMAVGYSTLYGDMAGGFDVLKDVPKTIVYELARWRNRRSEVIPTRVIERAPSAELAPDQRDEDSLPPYPVLDQILEYYIEQDLSAEAIIALGFDAATTHRVLRLVDINEYKRRQAPIGVRISRRAFGRDRRYPVTSGWKPGQ
jgi:NAD+ synthase (glutamine-hydrolysing)